MSASRRYLAWLLGLLFVEVMSWWLFSQSPTIGTWGSPMGYGFLVLCSLAVLAAWRRPQWLAWATMIELVIGGKGYLFFLQDGNIKISLRLAFFAILMLAWMIRLVRSRPWRLPRWAWPIIASLGWVMIMSAVGWWRGFGGSGVFTDMNGYLFAAIVFPWWYFVRRDSNWKHQVGVVVLTGATIVGLKSWLMQVLFAQDATWVPTLYKWIRQTGIGEITLISKNVYRIFFQSQIYTLLAFGIVMAGWMLGTVQRWWVWTWLSAALGVYLSLSRSFWLGGAVMFVAMVWLSVRFYGWVRLRRLVLFVPLGAFVWLMTTLALNFPYIIPPPGQTGHADAIVARLKSAGSRQASTARANQIPPLMTAISHNPLTGQGFGATLTYTSTDPRIRGARTTSAFELGYLDMVFHFGLIGLGFLGWWIWMIGRRLWQRQAWVWLVPTLGLLVVHTTSPYLNHPLGLGWLALMTLFAYDE